MCLLAGQQTLSEEVTERIRSRMLKLEKENQSLLRTIEELRSVPQNSHHAEGDHVCEVVCCTSNGPSSTDVNTTLFTSFSNMDNCQDVITPRKVKLREPECPQHLPTDELESERVQRGVHHFTNGGGQLEDGSRGEHLTELMSDLEEMENGHNRQYSSVESHDHSPGSRSSSPRPDSIFAVLPTHTSYASKQTQRLEAKCRALDSTNQHLQTSLDNTGGFCK